VRLFPFVASQKKKEKEKPKNKTTVRPLGSLLMVLMLGAQFTAADRPICPMG
jgi:hypothetical protein